MTYTINELKEQLFHSVYEVYRVFQDFFGEDYTDLQNLPSDEHLLPDGIPSGQLSSCTWSEEQLNSLKERLEGIRPFILVYWPEVTVTNENDRFIQIQDLYAKIEITMDGRIPYENIGFQLNRTTFNDIQFSSGYVHSHVPSRYSGELPTFQNPCLGRGPIRHTIADLHNNCEEVLWMLFCQELSLYVTVESLRGGPYRKLEEVGLRNKVEYGYRTPKNIEFSDLTSYQFQGVSEFKEFLVNFTDYYLSLGELSLCFKDGMYVCSMPYYNYMLSISNAFISWFNQHGDADEVDMLYSRGLLIKVSVSDGKFYTISDGSSSDPSSLMGRPILTFKGEEKFLQVIPTEQEGQPATLLLCHNIAMYILQRIIKIINYHYEHNNTNGGEETSSPAYQTACYL